VPRPSAFLGDGCHRQQTVVVGQPSRRQAGSTVNKRCFVSGGRAIGEMAGDPAARLAFVGGPRGATSGVFAIGLTLSSPVPGIIHIRARGSAFHSFMSFVRAP